MKCLFLGCYVIYKNISSYVYHFIEMEDVDDRYSYIESFDFTKKEIPDR